MINSSMDMDMEAYCWTDEAISFVKSLPTGRQQEIVNIASLVGCIVVIIGKNLHNIYPFGYEIHNKDWYVSQYDKKVIADDIGCSVDDIEDWDAYSIEINNVWPLRGGVISNATL